MFSQDVGAVHLRVEDRAALAAGAGGDVDVDALGDVLRRRRRALARLVVGVGVHVHQPERRLRGRSDSGLRRRERCGRATCRPLRRTVACGVRAIALAVARVVGLGWLAWTAWFHGTPRRQLGAGRLRRRRRPRDAAARSTSRSARRRRGDLPAAGVRRGPHDRRRARASPRSTGATRSTSAPSGGPPRSRRSAAPPPGQPRPR